MKGLCFSSYVDASRFQCGSTDHLSRNCPQKGKGKGKPKGENVNYADQYQTDSPWNQSSGWESTGTDPYTSTYHVYMIEEADYSPVPDCSEPGLEVSPRSDSPASPAETVETGYGYIEHVADASPRAKQLRENVICCSREF